MAGILNSSDMTEEDFAKLNLSPEVRAEIGQAKKALPNPAKKRGKKQKVGQIDPADIANLGEDARRQIQEAFAQATPVDTVDDSAQLIVVDPAAPSIVKKTSVKSVRKGKKKTEPNHTPKTQSTSSDSDKIDFSIFKKKTNKKRRYHKQDEDDKITWSTITSIVPTIGKMLNMLSGQVQDEQYQEKKQEIQGKADEQTSESLVTRIETTNEMLRTIIDNQEKANDILRNLSGGSGGIGGIDVGSGKSKGGATKLSKVAGGAARLLGKAAVPVALAAAALATVSTPATPEEEDRYRASHATPGANTAPLTSSPASTTPVTTPATIPPAVTTPVTTPATIQPAVTTPVTTPATIQPAVTTPATATPKVPATGVSPKSLLPPSVTAPIEPPTAVKQPPKSETESQPVNSQQERITELAIKQPEKTSPVQPSPQRTDQVQQASLVSSPNSTQRNIFDTRLLHIKAKEIEFRAEKFTTTQTKTKTNAPSNAIRTASQSSNVPSSSSPSPSSDSSNKPTSPSPSASPTSEGGGGGGTSPDAQPTSAPSSTPPSDATSAPSSTPSSGATVASASAATGGGGGGPPLSSPPSNVTVGGTADLSKVDQGLLSNFYSAAQQYGKPLTINSGYRSDEKQAELWVRGNILHEPGISIPAKPEQRQHIKYKGAEYDVPGGGRPSQHGHAGRSIAIDISSGAAADMDKSGVLAQHGLHRPWPGADPVHIQQKGAQVSSGGSSASTPSSAPSSGAAVASASSSTGSGGGGSGGGSSASTPSSGAAVASASSSTGSGGSSGSSGSGGGGSASRPVESKTSIGNVVQAASAAYTGAKTSPASQSSDRQTQILSNPRSGSRTSPIGIEPIPTNQSDPGNVEPLDAVIRYATLFNIAA